ncbi:hypothetical protein ZHAS_00015169 [Anopheles sinensis]|uniref:Uncharacterized protein n=1 Tax=Anopheles sinensis TaxID=74873 RepID=A0A084WA76_ANOSI|nr:hypothetical protein ZHAS_00015169 [Anopheles sinensis]
MPASENSKARKEDKKGYRGQSESKSTLTRVVRQSSHMARIDEMDRSTKKTENCIGQGMQEPKAGQVSA